MMRRHTPLQPLGTRGRRLQPNREQNTMEARKRAGWRCEGCGKSEKYTWLDGAHRFGRRNIIGEPMASWPECIAALCRDCHQKMDRYLDTELQDRIRWQGIRNIQERTGIDPPCHIGDKQWQPVDVARWYERNLPSELLTP